MKCNDAICGQRRPRPVCAFVQADQDLCCPLTESIDIAMYADVHRLHRSDCTDSQADLGFRCSLMA